MNQSFAAGHVAPRSAAQQRVAGFELRRALQLALGVLWLLDGMLQFQPFMFGRGFAQMLANGASGNPAAVARPVTWSATLIGHHQVGLNAAFATVQLLLGLGIAWRPTVRSCPPSSGSRSSAPAPSGSAARPCAPAGGADQPVALPASGPAPGRVRRHALHVPASARAAEPGPRRPGRRRCASRGRRPGSRSWPWSWPCSCSATWCASPTGSPPPPRPAPPGPRPRRPARRSVKPGARACRRIRAYGRPRVRRLRCGGRPPPRASLPGSPLRRPVQDCHGHHHGLPAHPDAVNRRHIRDRAFRLLSR